MNRQIENSGTGAARTDGSRFRFYAISTASLSFLLLAGCTIFASRPIQLMSDTSSALRAAKDVQADTLAPELYRQANEWFFRAKHEYKFKNFKLATDYASKARLFAEQAEFQALKNGGKYADIPPPETPSAPPSSPSDYATPTPTPYMEGMERQQPSPPSAPTPPAGGPAGLGPMPTH